MIVVAEQPHYLPWLDYYEQAARADVLVILDDVQWLRRGWQRRTRVAPPPGSPPPAQGEPDFRWLSIPLLGAGHHDPLGALAIDAAQPWARRHLATFDHVYGRRPFYRTQVRPLLQPWLERAAAAHGPGSLVEVLLESTTLFFAPLGIAPRLVRASTLPRQAPGKTERLVELCQRLSAHTYYSGLGSVLYLKPGPFRAADVRLLWQRFRHPPYDQGGGRRSTASLSIVDVLSNVPLDEVRRWLAPPAYGPLATAAAPEDSSGLRPFTK